MPSASGADVPTITGIASRSGLPEGGQSITIVGTNLTNVVTVKFGSIVTSSVVRVSSTQLRVLTPPHGSGKVSVRAIESGTNAMSPESEVATFVYLVRPATLANAGTARTHAELADPEVSCGSATWCGAAGMFFIDSAGHQAGQVFNGSTWSAQKAFNPDSFTVDRGSVSCVVSPSKLCMFGDYNGVVWRTTNGSTYASTSLDLQATTGSTGTPNLTCATSTFCMASYGAYVWTWNGSTWGQPEHVLGVGGRPDGRIGDLSCPTTAFCQGILAESPARAIRWQSGTWSQVETVRTGDDQFQWITCSAANYCLATGNFGEDCSAVSTCSGYLAWTGVAWSPPMPGEITTSYLQRPTLECLSPSACVAQESSRTVTFNGTSRGQPSLPALSCWAPYSCLAVSEHASYLTKRGAS